MTARRPMTTHQRRRIVWLWAPLALAGVSLILTAIPLSLTLNGLGLAGMTVAFLALSGAMWDEHNVARGWWR